MQIQIFDVEHGFCACVFADDGRVLLIDCGHNSTTGFRPSEYLHDLGVRKIDVLVITNYDEDHLSDLGELRRRFRIGSWVRNWSLDLAQLARVKDAASGVGPGIGALLDLLADESIGDLPLEGTGIRLTQAYNNYPDFEDTNNLSLVAFLDYGDVHIVFPGDLEVPGWQGLLSDGSFVQSLGYVNLFVASHHGRQNGYCADVFAHCFPELIIVSDAGIQHASQMVDYSRHASGVLMNGSTRHVLTTRNDGEILIEQQPGRGAAISTSQRV